MDVPGPSPPIRTRALRLEARVAGGPGPAVGAVDSGAPLLIDKILSHLGLPTRAPPRAPSSPCRSIPDNLRSWGLA